ncbi:MAG: glycosyltransferase [Gammaproteobacteria bacterium]|nr:glycosyltransferase [Gammaproteobacteria bacterium]MDH3464810.1 glycosyltransferase [Gammaproteobacteria bacterium]
MTRIAILLPCHNEAQTIARTVKAFRQAVPTADVWVCDNASGDATSTEALSAGAITIVEPRLGKGEAVRRLFGEVDADVYVLCDGDSTYDASSAQEMIDKLVRERLDMVVGNRLSQEGQGLFRLGHRLGNRGFSLAVQYFFDSKFCDLLSGYRVFSRRFVKTFAAESKGFEIETELTIFALESRIPVGEIDVKYFARPEGSTSKLSTYKDGFRILRTIILLVRDVRPLPFFSFLAGLMMTVGVAVFIPIWQTFLSTHLVPKIPSVILISLLFILAVVSLACGVILDRVASNRRYQQRIAYLAQPAPPYAPAGDRAATT